MALLVRGTNYFKVENEKAVGPNVISFKLITGRRQNERWYAVGCYHPPSDKEGGAHRRTKAALEAQPAGTWLLLFGDLNAGLDCPCTRQEKILVAELEEHGLRCVTDHFLARRMRRCRGRWTWQRRNKGGRGEGGGTGANQTISWRRGRIARNYVGADWCSHQRTTPTIERW